MRELPKCATEGCGNPAMVQCPDCGECWLVRFDAWWAQRFPDEDESLPFDTPVNDTEWTDEMEAITQLDEDVSGVIRA